jgi:hypothetical protein
MFSATFLTEVNAIALNIAWRQRRELHLQPLETLYSKFLAERQELEEVWDEGGEVWDELPDLCYYIACMIIKAAGSQDERVNWAKRFLLTAKPEGVTRKQLEAGTLAKYRLRARQPKDIVAERTAILEAVRKNARRYRCSACSVETDPAMIGEWNCCKEHVAMGGDEPYPVEI